MKASLIENSPETKNQKNQKGRGYGTPSLVKDLAIFNFYNISRGIAKVMFMQTSLHNKNICIRFFMNASLIEIPQKAGRVTPSSVKDQTIFVFL